MFVLYFIQNCTSIYKVQAMNTASNPKVRATQELEAAIARYRSVENKRIALRNAMRTRPDDPRLKQVLEQLTTPQLVQKAFEHGIFMNYTRSDEVFALDLATNLHDAGVTVWMDIMDIQDDNDWWNEVKSAMERCGIMIAVMSPEALLDNEGAAERHEFMEMGKLILPVISERCDVSRHDFWLETIDFTRDFNLGWNVLKRLLPAVPQPTRV